MNYKKCQIWLILLLFVFRCYAQEQNQKRFNDTLKYAYVVVYESSDQIGDFKKEQVDRRTKHLSEIIEKESLGRLNIEVFPIYVNINSFSETNLIYERFSFFEWMDRLINLQEFPKNVDVVSLTPAIKIPWASDSHSLGFFYKNYVCFTLESYPYDKDGNMEAIGLSVHKMFHGFGYNHQNINMPALKLLNWELGFPVNTGLDFVLRKKDGYGSFYFNKHILDVLETSDTNRIENSCLDCVGLVAKSSKYVKGWTEDAFAPYCFDADHDGIVDGKDDYFLSPPLKGSDEDADGIPDKLDLYQGNKISVMGNIDARKINLTGIEDTSEITFLSDEVNITHIKVYYFKKVPVYKKPDHFPGCFPANEFSLFEGNKIVLKKDMKKPPIMRIEVCYVHNNKKFYRPYYFYFPGTPVLQIINEREWFYFLRFGVDVPEGIDFYEVRTYDEDYNGFFDFDKNDFFNMNANYDWDQDGVSDLEDDLPTVSGEFRNEFVRGVMDSDHDGLANPGELDFSEPNLWISKSDYFGELPRIIGKNKNYDPSPYIKSNESVNKKRPITNNEKH